MNVGEEVQQLCSDAYTAVMRAFTVKGLDFNKEQILAKLREELNVSQETHYDKLNQAMTDIELTSIRQAFKSGGPSAVRQVESSAVLATTAPAQAPLRPPAPTASARVAAALPDSPLDVGGGSSRRARLRKSRVLGDSSPVVPNLPTEPTALLGRKVWRYWPNEVGTQNGWAQGVITDYNEAKDAHVIAYDLGTAKQSYEFYDFRKANPDEYDVLMNEEPVDLRTVKGTGGGKGSKKRGRAAAGLDAIPFEATVLTARLASGSSELLMLMMLQLDRRERDIIEELARMEDEERGLDMVAQLESQLARLADRERNVKQRLLAIN